MPDKPILCLDFDGVIHSYTSKWEGARVIPDPPVPGAREFLINASALFEIHIFSSRSHQEGGLTAMGDYVGDVLAPDDRQMTKEEEEVFDALVFATTKPPALVTIDDRAITFTGTWPDPSDLLEFKPWNRRAP